MLVTLITLTAAFFVKNQKGRYREKQKYNQELIISRGQGLGYLCLGVIFTVLFLLSALRLEVGNDYGTYVDTIHEIYVGGYVVTEPLFNGVVKALCILSGGENYLLVFGVFAFVTIWLFLEILYHQSDNFFLAFFLFMTLGIYFRTFNTVRYYFVLALALYSLRYVLQKEYGKFILMIGFGALFHKSVLVVVPLYLIAALPWKKWHVAVMTGLGVVLVAAQDLVIWFALILYPSYRNTIYLETESGFAGNIMTLVRCIAVCLLALVCGKKTIRDNPKGRLYFQMNLLAIGLYTFASFLPLVGRLGYYLITSHVLLIPLLLKNTEDAKKRRLLTAIVIGAGVLYFLYFLMTADREGVRVLPYKSWLFYEKEFLNAGEIF